MSTNLSSIAIAGTVFGIDSHARTTTICALVRETGETRTRTFRGNDYAEMRGWMSDGAFPKPALGVYESGCTGFVPARELTSGDVAVVPIATSKMPSSCDSRTRKNDRSDAARLARLAVAGELREVWVPDAEVEGLRDLSQAIEDLRDQRDRARRRVEALLCRHGEVWSEVTPKGRPRRAWGARFRAWAGSRELPGASAEALLAALRAADSAAEQLDALVARAREVARASALGPTIDALTSLKCVEFLTALAFCAVVGDFSRFASGRRITSYLGLAPSESSSSAATRLGPATKCGPTLVRRMLVECAWAATRLSAARAKPRPEGVDPAVAERARTLSRRLADHRRGMLARGVQPNKANVATAAELGRFMLFLGRRQQELATATS